MRRPPVDLIGEAAWLISWGWMYVSLGAVCPILLR